ncbi:MAG: CRISPR-associated helicase Cas3' [Deltaproteobacteria bacterium]|nr:CRISPR-associated helicase Cas3' [Deltaproteobacteria bacterium]
MDKDTTYYKYWGKTEKDGSRYHLLPYHCLDVAAVGYTLLKNNPALRQKFTVLLGLEETVCIPLLVISLALHDIGKYSHTFQNLRPDILEQLQNIAYNKIYTVRHDSLGNLLLKASFETENIRFPEQFNISFDEWQDVIMPLLRAFTGHHGKPPEMMGPNGIPLNCSNFFTKGDTAAAITFAKDVGKMVFHPREEIILPCPDEIEASMKKASWLMAGFAVLCDWLGSNISWFSFCAEPMPIENYWKNRAIPQALKAVRESLINAGIPLVESFGFAKLFPHILSPTPLQVFVDEFPVKKTPQLFIFEDITGSGKTEAALILAGRLMSAGCGTGMFFALPTMATSNAMYDRIAKVYKKFFEINDSAPSLVLAHGSSHLSESFMATITTHDTDPSDEDPDTGRCSSWLADNRKKSLLADVGIGTLDQALLAILPARFQSLRLYGLANHILIVDEVHAYDPYMNKLLQNLLSFHSALGGSAILLSATLPSHIRQDFVAAFARGSGDSQQLEQKSCAYPLATVYEMESGIKEIPIDANPQRYSRVTVRIADDESVITKQIEEAANEGKCVCWIRNTVHDAMAGYSSLKAKLDENNLMLFHARFAMGDRLDIEGAVIRAFGKDSTARERSGKVLIATQVVEQSLDLDFDLLISDLAPMDLLIQRAGRLHRHRRDERGNPLPDGADQREKACIIIHGPQPEERADENWYKSAFPKAAFVYPNHGCLWLTAKLLTEKGELKMPDDARELIEAAFSDDTDRIPEPLQRRDRQTDAKWQADKSLAHINMLKLDEGYEATITQWREDMDTPTRLGTMERTVRLAKWNGETLFPWYTHERVPWDMSQVNVRSFVVNAEFLYDGVLGQEMAKTKEWLPDKGKWTVLVPLQEDEDGYWRGKALNKKNEVVMLGYNRKTGVTVTKKED